MAASRARAGAARRHAQQVGSPLRVVSLQEAAPSGVIQELYRTAVRFGRSAWAVKWFKPRRQEIQRAITIELQRRLNNDPRLLWLPAPYLDRHAVVEAALQAAYPDEDNHDGATTSRAALSAINMSGEPELFIAHHRWLAVDLVEPHIGPLCEDAGYNPTETPFALWSAICLLAQAATQFEMIRHLPLLPAMVYEVESESLTTGSAVSPAISEAMRRLQLQMVAFTNPTVAAMLAKGPGRRTGGTARDMEYLRAIDDGSNDEELRRAIEELPEFVAQKESLDRKERVAEETLAEQAARAAQRVGYVLNYKQAYKRAMTEVADGRVELRRAIYDKFRAVRRRN